MTDHRTRICLYSLEQAALIIVDPSGPIYFNQAAGTACAQPEVTGYLVPFSNDPPLDSAPEATLWRRLRAAVLDCPRLSSSEADAIDAVLAQSPLTSFITVDRDKLDESMEAWVYVNVGWSSGGDYSGVIADGAVLTWPNSD